MIFIPGNHDEALREYVDSGIQLGNIDFVREYTHTLADGRVILCVHGDEFDVVTRYHRWLAVLGDVGYHFLMWVNRQHNNMRRTFGMGYWSLSKYVKHKVKGAVNFIGNFEENVVREVKERGVDGVMCGHIHHAEMREIDGVLYLNDGDWVESCTSIVEHQNGTLEIIRWVDEKTFNYK